MHMVVNSNQLNDKMMNMGKMMKYYGTLGPACAHEGILTAMFRAGMTGLRLNTSHGRLADAADWIRLADTAAKMAGKEWELLIDLKGPELRIGHLASSLPLVTGLQIEMAVCGHGAVIPVPEVIFDVVKEGQFMWLDDSQIKLRVESVDTQNKRLKAVVVISGLLRSGKSLAIDGIEIPTPALNTVDMENIRYAGQSGLRLAAVMQPFVRNTQDLLAVRQALDENGCKSVAIMAKIENKSGVQALQKLLPFCDSVVIARGDLGTSVSLPMLPVVQKQVEDICHRAGKPYMVVTQMLNSMMQSMVPTRAEVSDIAHAVFGGADSLMLTGETAAGKYPIEAMRCLVETAENARRYMIQRPDLF